MRGILKKALSSVLFCAILVGLLLGLSALLPSTYQDVISELLNEPKNTVDVFFVGNSEVYTGVIPLYIWEKYGYTAYCCSTSQQHLDNSEALLHKAFNRHSPKIVMLEAESLFTEITFESQFFDFMADTFPISDAFNRWKSLNKGSLGLTINARISNTKGYKFSSKTTRSDASHHLDPTDECEEYPTGNEQYILRIKEYCEKHGARFVLFSMPSTLVWSVQRHNAIAQVAEEYGIEYIDLNMEPTQVSIDWRTDSRDRGDHLNHYGAEKVTAYLGEFLSETGLLQSHKGDEAYASWDTASANFNEAVKQYMEAIPKKK